MQENVFLLKSYYERNGNERYHLVRGLRARVNDTTSFETMDLLSVAPGSKRKSATVESKDIIALSS